MNKIKQWFWPLVILLGILFLVLGSKIFGVDHESNVAQQSKDVLSNTQKRMTKVITNPNDVITKGTAIATFAAGCFRCTEAVFQEEPGVLDAISGYAGGEESDATYEKIGTGKTDHREAIQVTYDATQISYERLLDLMFRSIDPTDNGGQFGDRGFQYTTAIFYHNEQQKQQALDAIETLSGSYDKSIATKILPFETFFEAEEYHQDFYKHSKERYGRYKKGSGRSAHFEETGLDQILDAQKQGGIDNDLRAILTPLQWKVTQENGTEPSFNNEYWDNEKPGLYVDIITGEPLYSSKHKYKSGTGWPSFTQPITEDAVSLYEDNKLWMKRTEVRNADGSSHLGHVFNDGPQDAGGMRYCMNSASMKFIPLENMEAGGYGERIQAVE